MAEPMSALAPASARRPAARKPRLPHPHLAAAAQPATPAAEPMARPAGQPRRRSTPTPAERTLRNALRCGFFVNGVALLIPRLFPAGPAWQYGADDFLLAAAVLLSGQILLLLGRRGD